MKTVGDRREVWLRKANRTRYGLTRSGLTLNKYGRIVSRKKQAQAKKKSNLGDRVKKTNGKQNTKSTRPSDPT